MFGLFVDLIDIRYTIAKIIWNLVDVNMTSTQYVPPGQEFAASVTPFGSWVM